jgi:hypothetical protein
MPMAQDKQHGGCDPNNRYCIFCTDEVGKLKSREAVRSGMVAFFMRKKRLDNDVAEKFVDDYMKKMPAWKKKK